jgi:hypothetical protein
MLDHQTNASATHSSTRASAHHPGSSGVARPSAAPLQKVKTEDPPALMPADRQQEQPGKAARPFTLQAQANDNAMAVQPRFVPRRKSHGRASLPPQLKAAGSPNTPVVQRVIAGLETYQDPAQIPEKWVNTYHQDLLDTTAFLSEDQVWNVFKRTVRPGMPYEYGVAINHEGGNHWTLTYKGANYQIMGDGSCGLHAVHLAGRLLNAKVGDPPVDPTVAYQAPPQFVTEQRKALYDDLTHKDKAAEANAEARRHISLAITNTEHVFETGFGPEMQQLLVEASIRGNPENLNRFVDLGFTGYWAENKKALPDLLKPSQARKVYQNDEFFRESQAKDSLDNILTSAIAKIFKEGNFLADIDFNDKLFQPAIKKWAIEARRNFRSPAAIKKELAAIKAAFVLKAAKKKRLKANGFLSPEQRAALMKKLKDPRFRRKIMLASRHAVMRFKKKKTEDRSFTKMISEGTLDFKAVPMSSAQVIESLHAFTTTAMVSKNDLMVGSGTGSYTSIGQGGLQVKGLDTYPEEMNWFSTRIKKWKVNPGDLFRALMTRNEEELKRLTKASAAEMKHMLSFRILQLEEIFRGMQFGIGVAAHLNLGFHGQSDISSYLAGMPMYAGGATTNVTRTDDWNKPHNPPMWEQQVQSTMDGIQQLVGMDVDEGQLYNMNAQTFLQQLHTEPLDDGEPSEELVDQSQRFMIWLGAHS